MHSCVEAIFHSFHRHVQNATIPCCSKELRSVFHSSLLHTFSCHTSPSTILPSSLNSSCHLFLGLPLNLVVSKFIYNTLLGTLFSSILCTCPNQHNLFNLLAISDKQGLSDKGITLCMWERERQTVNLCEKTKTMIMQLRKQCTWYVYERFWIITVTKLCLNKVHLFVRNETW